MKRKLAGSRAEARSRERGTRGKTAFTLIELLVVIAVIAILAALLLPALNRARNAADSAVCKSNLHQISVSLHLYADDYKAYPIYETLDWVGGPVTTTTAFTTHHYWSETLQPYTKATPPVPALVPGSNDWPNGLYDCPSYKRLPGRGRMNSYAYNVSGVELPLLNGSPLGIGGRRLVPDDQDAVGPNAFGPNLESEVLQPSDMMALGDGFLEIILRNASRGLPTIGVDPILDEPLRAVQERDTGDDFSSGGFAANNARHSGRFNVAFCDAHVESLRYQILYSYGPDCLRRWNNDGQPHRELLPGPGLPGW